MSGAIQPLNRTCTVILPLPEFKSYERDKNIVFEKEICDCDEKREYRMETAHAAGQ